MGAASCRSLDELACFDAPSVSSMKGSRTYVSLLVSIVVMPARLFFITAHVRSGYSVAWFVTHVVHVIVHFDRWQPEARALTCFGFVSKHTSDRSSIVLRFCSGVSLRSLAVHFGNSFVLWKMFAIMACHVFATIMPKDMPVISLYNS